MKIKIVRVDGSPASLGRLLVRRFGVNTVISMIPLVGPFYGLLDSLLIFTAGRRCLHDRIADTIVVKA